MRNKAIDDADSNVLLGRKPTGASVIGNVKE